MARMGALLLGTAAAALIAACGSSSSSSSTSTSSSSTTTSTTSTASAGGQVDSAFATRANTVCTSSLQQLALVPQPGNPLTVTAADLPKWASYLDQVIPIQTQNLRQLQALGAPAQGLAAYQAAAAAGLQVSSDLTTLQTAAHAGDLNSFDAGLLSYATHVTTANTAFKTAGIPACQTPLPGQSTGASSSTTT